MVKLASLYPAVGIERKSNSESRLCALCYKVLMVFPENHKERVQGFFDEYFVKSVPRTITNSTALFSTKGI